MTPIPKPRLSRAVLLERLPGYVPQAVLLAIIAWLVWRGVASKTLDLSTDPDKNYRTLEKAVAKLFKNYPPGVGKR